MNRSQIIAALVVVVALGGLVLSRVNRDGPEAAASLETTTDATPAAEGDAASETETDSAEESASETVAVQVEAPPVLDPKPALTAIDGWINTDAASLDDFAGQVRVVEFWTFGCFNCKNRIPHTQELYAEYKDQGLEIIGIHSPEFEFERDPDSVLQATKDLGVTWPVALDTEKTNFRAWQGNRRFWPRVYVLDQNGDVRYDHIGERDYDGLEQTVAYLIENGP